ncbi:MAG: hypothetical protein ABI895_32670 [Deltaproteobacteria bacterium]
MAFLALAAVLLTPLGFLFLAIEGRVEAQRRLRHEVVAERIFDELERELTAVLAAESARPSSAYDEPTRSEAWAPFVVGYFKIGAAGVELLARSQLDSERMARLTAALGALSEPPRGSTLGQIRPAEEPSPTSAPARAFAAKSSPDVLQKLNRSQEDPVRRKAAAPASKSSRRVDPLMGF